MSVRTVSATLCYIIKDGKILFLERTRGLGAGKTNAPGGKLKSKETPEKGVMREGFEETGLKLSNLKSHGILNFFFGQKAKPNWVVHVFSTNEFDGEIKESDEGKLKWCDIDKIPYDRMWEDDRHWVPLLLEGKKFQCQFFYDRNIEKLFEYVINLENQTA